MTYEFDHLLTDHLDGDKLAFWGSMGGAALKGLGNFGYNAARSAVPFLGKSTGAGVAGTIGYNAGGIKDALKSIPGSFNMSTQQPGFKPQSSMKLSSQREMRVVERAMEGAFNKAALEDERPSIMGGALRGALYGSAAGGVLAGLGGGVRDAHEDYNDTIDYWKRRSVDAPWQDPLIMPGAQHYDHLVRSLLSSGLSGGLDSIGRGAIPGAAVGALAGGAHSAWKQHQYDAAHPSAQ